MNNKKYIMRENDIEFAYKLICYVIKIDNNIQFKNIVMNYFDFFDKIKRFRISLSFL